MSRKKPLPPNIKVDARGNPICTHCGHRMSRIPNILRNEYKDIDLACFNQVCELSPIKAIRCRVDTMELKVTPNSYSENHQWLQLVKHEFVPSKLRSHLVRGRRDSGEILRSSYSLKRFMSSRRKNAEFLKWGFQRSSSRGTFIKDVRKFIFGVKSRTAPIVVHDFIHYM